MAMPVSQDDIERVLRPWLGSLFLGTNSLCAILTNQMMSYAPYRQTLDDLHDIIERTVLTNLNKLTRGSMTIVTDNYHSKRIGTKEIARITDELMGVVFDKLTPFSANFVKLNDYSLRYESLEALRVLYQKYQTYYNEDQFRFMIQMIRKVYPPERYQHWLVE
ncbi:MAG: hypothetical protein GX096_07365 [Clostridiales bacterium]|nr:hypothetical protein [Clostridiales bacterium]